MRYILIFSCLSSISCFGQQTDSLLQIQKSHYEWFIEQTVDNQVNKKIILQKDSTIRDLNKVVGILQDEVGSLKRDSTKSTEQNTALLAESTLLQTAYKTQTKAITQLEKKEGILKVVGLSLLALVILTLVHH